MRRLLLQELSQRQQEGCKLNAAEWHERIEAAGQDVGKLDRLYDELMALPVADDFPFGEPSELDRIREASPAGAGRFDWPLSDKAKLERFHGAWLGRCVGCALGKPFETEPFIRCLEGHKHIRRYLQAGLMEGGVVGQRSEGTPQGGPLSPLLSNVLLDDLDRELERRGHRFVRYADDCNVYVRSRAAGERVMASLEEFLAERLRLEVNRSKSAVDRPWKRKFLGYTVTWHRQPRLKVSPESVKRLKTNLRPALRAGRGRSLARVVRLLSSRIRGWVAYFRLAEVKASFEMLDMWLRRKLRCILWRQWKRAPTRMKELRRRGLSEERAAVSAYNGCGPWWNAGASHMNQAVPTAVFRRLGLVSFIEEHRRLARSM